MKKRRAKGLRIAGKTILFLLLFLCVGAAAFGFYRIADKALDRMFPPAGGIKVSQPSSLPSSSAALSSLSAASGTQYNPVKGLFSAYSEAAQRRLAKMTTREKVGQVFLVTCPAAGQVKVIDDYQPCGYCLTARDFEGKTADQVRKTLASYQNSSKIKMILCCDEEGGTVVRISKFPALSEQKFRSPQQIFHQSGLDGIKQDTEKKSRLMESLGLNLNLAPVCDVSVNPSDFIYARSFGQNAEQTAEFVTASVKAYRAQGLACTLKHFPGYGNNADTHTGVATDKRSYQTFQQYDFLPFQAGIQAGAPCVMVCHNIVECMDSRNPASLSPQVHRILRETLGFSGVVMTDDLSMKGVTNFLGGKNAAVKAFQAGNDLLLTPDIKDSFNTLYAAVEDGTISVDRLNDSVLRILAWKYSMGMLS
ncbi:glycoside hydrolase family 3 protein [Caproicibacter fermentans]|uniref:beta-N-acetylhexosaminidase n=1 Tax=Caproicibacter fermentans TaxID=2576756 RepID=A0A7G8TE73_9FIRM|nr:glycoside hydrolase family 3 N-terminal domain-containing protein [Caproicibacter fermentans]QNK41914.1 beta-hexosaminidase [Caproicibacter fermentans]